MVPHVRRPLPEGSDSHLLSGVRIPARPGNSTSDTSGDFASSLAQKEINAKESREKKPPPERGLFLNDCQSFTQGLRWAEAHLAFPPNLNHCHDRFDYTKGDGVFFRRTPRDLRSFIRGNIYKITELFPMAEQGCKFTGFIFVDLVRSVT